MKKFVAYLMVSIHSLLSSIEYKNIKTTIGDMIERKYYYAVDNNKSNQI